METTNMKEMRHIYKADESCIIGNVEMGENVNVWYHATIRADLDKITIGTGTNIQDNVVLHVDDGYPLRIGDYVTVGHGAILHGCTVGNNTVIGMGAIVLNSAVIGENCIIGAGALITQNCRIPDCSVVLGNPGKVYRNVTEEEILHNRENAIHYVKEAVLSFGKDGKPVDEYVQDNKDKKEQLEFSR
jgi:carbonic anhydrase/acetyltransferase-like protein (isoleucine patch superfamily)